MVSAIAPMLNQIGFDLSKSQLYWLTSISGLACGLFRLLFMFLGPNPGKWTRGFNQDAIVSVADPVASKAFGER